MPKAKKMGRPKLPKGHAKGVIRPVRFTEAELKVFEKAARASEHKTLSGWIRQALREKAAASEIK
jgi:hypothetical protein